MPSLNGKTVLITGASSGIGQATALAFAAAGFRLILAARRLDRLTHLGSELAEAGAPAVHNLRLDVQDRAAVTEILGSLSAEWQPDILINNAGLSRGLTKLYEDDPGNWQEMIDTNIKGLLYVTHAIVPGMVARGNGHVINLGSTAGHQTYANGAVYCATKAAEKSITEGLRIDTIGKGIRVTSIDPGMVQTAFSEVRFRGDQAKAAKVYENITPLQPEDVADAILYAATRPPHVQIQQIIMTTIDQANATTFNRRISS